MNNNKVFINLILNIKTSALKDENIDKAFKYMIDLIEKDENSSNSDDTTEYKKYTKR